MSISGPEIPPQSNNTSSDDLVQDAKSTTPAAGERKQARAKQPPVENLCQLLDAIYSGKFKRLQLKKTELSALRVAPKIEDKDRDNLINTATTDKKLDKTRHLMLLANRIQESVVANQLNEFARDVLRLHPAFIIKAMEGVLENLPESPPEADVVKELFSQDFTALSMPPDNNVLKKNEVVQCRSNALNCLLLWFKASRGMSTERIQRYLNEYLWAPAARRYKNEAERLAVLITTRDPASVAIVSAQFEKQVLMESQRADAARRAEERATNRIQELETRLDKIAASLHAAQTDVTRLGVELDEEKNGRRNDRTHMQDDYEGLRGQVLRRLREELSLLDEGLHALRRDPPKVHVMVDHAERAINGLKLEMKRLQGED